jgi:hypothetical protein
LFQKKHLDIYQDELCRILDSENIVYQVISIDKLTDGAVSTALVACEYIDVTDQLIIANSDQWVDWDIDEFLGFCDVYQVDGAMPVFIENVGEPKWSFVHPKDGVLIDEVRAKDPFTNVAVVGIYYFKSGGHFITYANRMVDANKRVNNEFYVCPVYNEMIADNKPVAYYEVNKMVALGTPSDYEAAKFIIT